MDEPDAPATSLKRTAAWAVHAFTAMGVVLAFLALRAVERGAFGEAIAWLLVALAVDGVDGTLSRAAKTRIYAGRIDGDTLDLVIDYLNYVFVPALLIVHSGLLPAGLELILAGFILVSALYNFARSDMKTSDNYFRGFPALWNVVAFYFWAAPPSPAVAALAIVVLAALTFAPIHVVHPFRVRDYGRWLPALALLWAAATAALLLPGLEGTARTALLWLSLACAAILMLLGLVRTWRGLKAVGAGFTSAARIPK